ncbi:MAG: hypothetical protein IJM92_11405 [Fibrobacter sp.]|uniref:hypothetical protein n=1 Tax=Fibrobacter sp. TaxID=35828 RepID=UPI0025C4A760|nr:hypothetical protein [Fibrobacter sp.]MBQ7080237.1 hypothetical protein [Fibrobacter sp.]
MVFYAFIHRHYKRIVQFDIGDDYVGNERSTGHSGQTSDKVQKTIRRAVPPVVISLAKEASPPALYRVAVFSV